MQKRTTYLACIVFLTFITSTYTHPQCNDFGPPFAVKKKTAMYCDMYRDYGCCTKEMDHEIRNIMRAIESDVKDEECLKILQELACQECSPYAAHIFETEGGGPKKPLPGLCKPFCKEVYNKCKKYLPLVKQNEEQRMISKAIKSENDFCKLVTLEDDAYCYPDVKSRLDLQEELERTIANTDECMCLKEVITGIANPLMLMSSDAKDQSNLIYVGTQAGKIFMYENGKKLKDVFLDITDKVLITDKGGDERGFLGLAFHSNFKQTQKFYVYYITETSDEVSGRVVEYKTVPNNLRKADPSSERLVFKITQPARNHNGGSLIFGSDGFLYIFLGDGGGTWGKLGDPQDPKVLLGSVLRIDVDHPDPKSGKEYSIPKDNPFKNEVFAYGVRNPYRASEDRGDPETGESKGIFFGDVGQNMYEEVNLLKKGGNFGWNRTHGPLSRCVMEPCQGKGIIPPIHYYDHKVGHSVIGGFVYRGCENPNYHGIYIFADYRPGGIFRLKETAKGKWENKSIDLCGTDFCFNGLTNQYQKLVVSVGEDYNGEVYLMTSNTASSTDTTAKIYKFVDPKRRGDPSTCRDRKDDEIPILNEPPRPTKKPPTSCRINKQWRYPGKFKVPKPKGQKRCKDECECDRCKCKKLNKFRRLLKEACKNNSATRKACCKYCKKAGFL